MSDSPTRAWTDFIDRVSFDDLPSDVVRQTKLYILDTIGCALGGYAIESGKNVIEAGLELGGPGQATVLGSGDKLHVSNAAYVNGKLSNLLDADEIFYSTKHIGGIPLFPSLSLGEHSHASGKEVIAAVALAYDFAARVGFCGSIFKNDPEKGFMASGGGTMAFGTFSAAVSAAKMLKLERNQIVDALTLAAHFAPGAMESKFAFAHSSTKYGDMGWFCHSGVIAGLLARHGYPGDPTILDGPAGLHKMTGALDFDYDSFTADLGDQWYILDAGFKPYPTCRWFHTGIKLFEDIIRERRLTPGDIDKITVATTPMVVGLPSYAAANNWADVDNKDASLSQFSITYALACTAYGIAPGPDWAMPQTLNDPAIGNFTKRITQVAHPEAMPAWSAYEGHPGKMHCHAPTSIELVTKQGTFNAESWDLPGDSWNPATRMSEEDIAIKFAINVRSVLSSKEVERLIETVQRLEMLDDIGELMALTAKLRVHT